MQKWKEMGKAVIIAAGMLVAALFLSVLLHGLTQCRFSEPLGLEDVQYMDSFTLADSTVVLQRDLEGRTILLEYWKNWLLPRYALVGIHTVEHGFNTAIVSPLAAYPVTVKEDTIAVGETDVGLRRGEFSAAYGRGMSLFLVAQYILYLELKKKKI